jgi:hypothetical protein
MIDTTATRRTVPDWPPATGRRVINADLPAEHVQHLDDCARREGCSRSAYLRQVIARDIIRLARRQAATRRGEA